MHFIKRQLWYTVFSLINAPGGVTFSKRGGGDYYGTKTAFPNTPHYFVHMILNNLQKKKTTPKSKDNEKVSRKILIYVPTLAKCNGTCTKKKVNTAIFQKCEISRAMDGIEDDLFQMDSFNSSDNNFEGHFSKKVQESFRKCKKGHPSYF